MNPIIDGIIALEGGYVFNPKDKGGATHWGITEATARAHGYAGDMRDLTHAEAYAILEEDYWIKPGFDVISTLSWPVSFELCDAAVNIGAYHPSAWLQRWLNVFNHEGKRYPDIHVDGNIGPRTLCRSRTLFGLARPGRGSRFGESPQLQSGHVLLKRC
ncbi:hypothetical protein SEEE0316_10380 [Salmonella enterica subsp. enterica serovar Enteritidis str. 648903 1-6]|nr:hypothetical protein SEEE0316_10380 [Salmonella enterica subsp. enterica serovar Enteritidis str. 648903 1-6]